MATQEFIDSIPIVSFGTVGISVDRATSTSTGLYGNVRSSGEAVNVAGTFGASFLGSRVNHIQTSVAFDVSWLRYHVDANGEPTTNTDLSDAYHSTNYTIKVDEDLFPVDAGISFWTSYDGYNTLHEHPGFSTSAGLDWFVAGGRFTGGNLVSSGRFVTAMPDDEPPEAITAQTDLNFSTGGGSFSYTGFQPGFNQITINNSVIDPNASQNAVLFTQVSEDVFVEFGDAEYIRLHDTSLSAWQAIVAHQQLGDSTSSQDIGDHAEVSIEADDGTLSFTGFDTSSNVLTI